MQFNDAQKQAIEVTCNSVVLAGAGSGKTTVLAERFIHLIETENVDVDQILTLTFTKKAAAEMYERIYTRLRQSGSPRALKQLPVFDRAQISTIDSFCSRIVKNWAESFGIPGNFAIEESKRFTEEASFHFILDNYRDESLKKLINMLGFEEVWTGLFQSLADTYITLAFDHDFEEMRQKQVQMLETELEERGSVFQRSIDRILRLPPSGKSIANNQEILRKVEIQEYISGKKYEELGDFLKALKLIKPGGKANLDIQILKEEVDNIRTEVSTISCILDTLQNQGLIKGIFRVLSDFQEYINDLKRSRNSLHFQDVANMALVTLLQNKSLRNYYKKQFRYIMIDEFQDNNHLQKELLFLLSEKKELSLDRVPTVDEIEEDKLFFVGDDKQSIYRFRGAEVSVFKELSRELAKGSSTLISLDTNYRSEPGLIHFFNIFFKELFGESKEAYEADFQNLLPRPGDSPVKPDITFLYKPYDREGGDAAFSNDESEAYRIAEYIWTSVRDNKYIIINKEGQRPATYNDFTVLMRSTSNQIIYERMFRVFGIPYSTQDVRSLFMEAPVNDIYNLLQLIVYPGDRLAYTAYLRSPMVNLSDDSIITILSRKGAFFPGDVSLPGDEKVKYREAGILYEEVLDRIDRVSLYSLIHFIWHRSGYRYFLLQNPRFHNFLEYFHYFVTLAEQSERKGENLAMFLDFIRENLGKYEKQDELEILKTDVEGVRLMTIHKSKGLEFEIVVLANTGNKGRNNGEKAPYWISGSYGLTLNIGKKNRFQELAELEDEKQETAELKRLLYVALTRARSHLIISGCHNRVNMNTRKAHLNMLRGALDLFTRDEDKAEDRGSFFFSTVIIKDLEEKQYYNHMQRSEISDIDKMNKIYNKLPLIRREYPVKEFSVNELNAAFVLYSQNKLNRKYEYKKSVVDSLLKSDVLRMEFGTLVHYILEHEIHGSFTVEDIPDAYLSKFKQEDTEAILANAMTLAENFIQSREGGLLADALRVETEYPFLYKFDSKGREIFIAGTVDLFFETRDRIYVLDFKTDLVLNSREYFFQLGLYFLAVTELCLKPVDCFLFPLRGKKSISFKKEMEPGYLTRELDRLIDKINRQEEIEPVQKELPGFF